MRPQTTRNRHRSGGVFALIFAVLLAAVTFAGCLDGVLPDDQDPEAVLLVDNEEPWTNETVEFDGAASTPPEQGEIVAWRFVIDGETVHEAESREEAIFEHGFEQGGIYNVSLTVTAEYENGEMRNGTDEITLGVNEEMVVENLTVDGNLSESAHRAETPFEVHPAATGWELDLQVENNNPIQPSEFIVRILDGDDQVIAEESHDLAAGDETTIQLSGESPGPGNHTFELEAESGSVTTSGQIDVRYGGTTD